MAKNVKHSIPIKKPEPIAEAEVKKPFLRNSKRRHTWDGAHIQIPTVYDSNVLQRKYTDLNSPSGVDNLSELSTATTFRNLKVDDGLQEEEGGEAGGGAQTSPLSPSDHNLQEKINNEKNNLDTHLRDEQLAGNMNAAMHAVFKHLFLIVQEHLILARKEEEHILSILNNPTLIAIQKAHLQALKNPLDRGPASEDKDQNSPTKHNENESAASPEISHKHQLESSPLPFNQIKETAALAHVWGVHQRLIEVILENIEHNEKLFSNSAILTEGIVDPLIFQLLFENALPLEEMLTQGLILAIMSQAVFMTICILANYFKLNDENHFKAFIAFVWPYCLEMIKSFQAVLEGIQILQETMHEMKRVPISSISSSFFVVLVFYNIVGSVFLHSLEEKRRKAGELLDESLDKANSAENMADLKDAFELLRKSSVNQGLAGQRLTILNSIYAATFENLECLNGLYFLALNPGVFMVALVFTSVYILMRVIKTIYEEHETQHALKEKTSMVRLICLSKQLMVSLDKENLMGQSLILVEDQSTALIKTLRIKISKECEKLQGLAKVSYSTFFFRGLKQGVAIYGALFGTLSAFMSFSYFGAIAFPPLLFVYVLGAGMLLLMASIGHALLSKKIAQIELSKQTLLLNSKLQLLNESEKSDHKDTPKISIEFMQEIIDTASGFSKITSAKNGIQGWSTVIESFFSGIRKVEIQSDETEGTEDISLRKVISHFAHIGLDSMFGNIVSAVIALFYGVSQAAEAFTKVFGKREQDLNEEDLLMKAMPLPLLKNNSIHEPALADNALVEKVEKVERVIIEKLDEEVADHKVATLLILNEQKALPKKQQPEQLKSPVLEPLNPLLEENEHPQGQPVIRDQTALKIANVPDVSLVKLLKEEEEIEKSEMFSSKELSSQTLKRSLTFERNDAAHVYDFEEESDFEDEQNCFNMDQPGQEDEFPPVVSSERVETVGTPTSKPHSASFEVNPHRCSIFSAATVIPDLDKSNLGKPSLGKSGLKNLDELGVDKLGKSVAIRNKLKPKDESKQEDEGDKGEGESDSNNRSPH